MKKIIYIILVVGIVIGVTSYIIVAKNKKRREKMIKITSPAFKNGDFIPQKYTCKGEDINPPLEFTNIPDAAKSLVLIMDDPDAPMGTWQHWLVWNISPEIKKIEENSVPKGAVLGRNDFGRLKYGGPCPPSGTHRYFFRLYALDVKLNLKEGATRKELDNAMGGHIIDSATLMGKFSH